MRLIDQTYHLFDRSFESIMNDLHTIREQLYNEFPKPEDFLPIQCHVSELLTEGMVTVSNGNQWTELMKQQFRERYIEIACYFETY